MKLYNLACFFLWARHFFCPRTSAQEGETLLRSALEGFQKQLGESHPQVRGVAREPW